jgi:hypothetical protein
VAVPPVPSIPGTGEGFRDRPIASLAGSTGWEPVLPAELRGLTPYRSGTYTGRTMEEVLLSFTRGLTWLKIRETRAWHEPALYGDVGELAQAVTVRSGVAYYEPATAELGRRLSIHSRGVDLYLDSNLPRSDLLDVAASLPVRGLRVPDRWLSLRLPGGELQERVTLEEAVRAAPFVLLPRDLPDGYRPAAAFSLRTGDRREVTVYFRRPGSELDGVGIRLHQASDTGLPPPTDPGALAVRVRGTTGRYSPSRGELEWIEDGVYRSLSGTALDLGGLLATARSLEAP